MPDNNSHHYFHAEAHALSGKLLLPFEEEIKEQASVKLEGKSKKLLLEGVSEELKRRKAQRNYRSQHAKEYRLEGIISYSAAHTQVSGHRSRKHPDRFVTLATSIVENLNVLNVVTADRVVAQISTTHLPGQYSPEVTFLGTHFENLRIARRKTLPILNLDFVGGPPKGIQGTGQYYPTSGTGLMASAERQFEKMRAGLQGFLSRVEEEQHRKGLFQGYGEFSAFDYKELQQDASAAAEKDEDREAPADNGDKWPGVTCSLVEHVKIDDGDYTEIVVRGKDPNEPPALVIAPPAHCFGHVIHVPDFGTVFLAELKVNHNSFHLTMIRLELGCIADGSASVAACNVNGGTGKGGGG